ncbi:MAG: acyl-CoA dehydrogenase family protein, partial [Candidatus Baltobacteraceae bacterium]
MTQTQDRTLQFELTEEQRAIRALARELAQGEIAPHIERWDRAHEFPRKLYTTFAQAGLMGLTIPERYGGAGADYVSYALAIEELARVDAGTATTLSVHLMIAAAILRLGSEAQRERYLPLLAGGDAIAAFALTEP